jgi:hypothetical protein
MTAAERMEQVVALLSGYRIPQATERQLQNGIATLLAGAGIAFKREFLLTGRDKPDFMLLPDVCLEVKIQGAAADVERQLLRYAASEHVSALLLVTTRRAHGVMPRVLMGKPLMTLCVGSAFL